MREAVQRELCDADAASFNFVKSCANCGRSTPVTESIGKIQSLGVFSELLAGCGSRPAVNSYCLGSTE